MDNGYINFKHRKPIDKTPAEYAPIKITSRKKVNLSDLPIKEDDKKYSWLMIGFAFWFLIVTIFGWFCYGLFEMVK